MSIAAIGIKPWVFANIAENAREYPDGFPGAGRLAAIQHVRE
jgi:hypothetical protein